MNWSRPLLLALALSMLARPAPAQVVQVTGIAAVVNEDVITGQDLSTRIVVALRSSGIEDTPQTRQRLVRTVLRGMIDEKLELQETKRLKVKLDDKELPEALGRLEKQNNIPEGGLDDFLKKAGMSKVSVLDQLTAQLVWVKFVRGRFGPDVAVTEEEVNEALARFKEDQGKPQSRVAQIFLAVDNPSQEEEVKRLADQLIQQLLAGARFAEVARAFSQDATATVGGDLGWTDSAQLRPPLNTAVAKMKPGEISYPIRTPGGYYILQVTDRTTPGVRNPDDAVVALAEVIFPLSAAPSPDERQRVEAEARQVADTAKSCGEMGKIGHERAPQLSTEIPQVKAADLPPELKRAVLTLPVAKASEPMALRGGIGVVMVCQRQEPSSGVPTRDEIADSIARQKLDALGRRYLRDLRRNAYVDIRAAAP